MHLGELISQYRAKNNMSMQYFANLSNLSKGYISMLEKNKNPKNGEPIIPSIDTFRKVAKAMHLSMADVMQKVDENQPVALGYAIEYEEREKIKAKARNKLTVKTGMSLDEKVSAQLDVFRALFARSFEASEYSLFHVDFPSYISMLLNGYTFLKEDEPALYDEMIKRYGIIDGSHYGISENKTYFSVPDKQGNYSTILDRQLKPNGTILNLIEKLSETGRLKVLSYVKDILSAEKFEQYSSSSSSDTVREREIIYLPELTSRFSAGAGLYDTGGSYELTEVPYSDLAAQATSIATISGRSMEPNYHDGDRILIQTLPDIDVGEVGVWAVNGELLIKEKGDGELISQNPDYDNIKIGECDSVYCIGKVIGKL